MEAVYQPVQTGASPPRHLKLPKVRVGDGSNVHLTMTTIQCSFASRCATVVLLESGTESFMAFDPAGDVHSTSARLNQVIAVSLLVSFGMRVLSEFTHGVLQ